jgi:hypothetical protein
MVGGWGALSILSMAVSVRSFELEPYTYIKVREIMKYGYNIYIYVCVCVFCTFV